MGDWTCPPGWTYNPSSWAERLWIAAVAGAGLLVANYLALYQWEVIEEVWEPFFGDGSEHVLSRVLPIPDAQIHRFRTVNSDLETP